MGFLKKIKDKILGRKEAKPLTQLETRAMTQGLVLDTAGWKLTSASSVIAGEREARAAADTNLSRLIGAVAEPPRPERSTTASRRAAAVADKNENTLGSTIPQGLNRQQRRALARLTR